MRNEGLRSPGTILMSRFTVPANRRAGFTLIEILVVIVIISISMGLVGIVVSRGGGSVKLKRFSLELAATIRYARNHAASEKKKLSLIIHEKTYDLYKDIAGYEETEDNQPVISKPIPEDIQIKFRGSEDDLFRIDFFPGGSSSGGVVDIIDEKGRNYRITVNRITGKLTIQKEGSRD